MFFLAPSFNRNVKWTCDHVKEERSKATAVQNKACNEALVNWLKQLQGYVVDREDGEDGDASDAANSDEGEGDNVAACLMD